MIIEPGFAHFATDKYLASAKIYKSKNLTSNV